MKVSQTLLLVLVLLALQASAISLSSHQASPLDMENYCSIDSYNLVGTPPNVCRPKDRIRAGKLCYDPCKAGFYFVPLIEKCVKTKCPDVFLQDGFKCKYRKTDTLSCQKYQLSNTTIPSTCVLPSYTPQSKPVGCPTDLVLSEQLCWPTCKNGFTTVGKRCEAKIPLGWIPCGTRMAKDAATCKNMQDKVPAYTCSLKSLKP